MMKALAVVFAAAVLFLFSCQNSNNNIEQTVRTVPVIKVAEQNITLPDEYVAQVRALRNVEIRARVQGYLDGILVDEGSWVEKDQVLFTINDQEYRQDYEKAKAVYSGAQADAKIAALEVERTRILVEKNVISSTELDLATVRYSSLKAKAQEALSALRHAEIRLSHTKIRAPFSGIIDRIPYKKGSLIREGEMLTSVSDNGDVYAYFNVSESEYLKLMKDKNIKKKESEVTMTLADGSYYPYKGAIETMAGEFDSGTGSIAFRARFPNPDKLLRHGATATVVIYSPQNSAIVLPQKATFEIQDKTFVYSVGADNKVKMTSITPRVRIDDFYVVSDGLKPGDQIVYEGIQFLRDDMVINPAPVRSDSLITYVSVGTRQVR